MNAARNIQATRLLVDLANRFNLSTTTVTAQFSDGSDGYLTELRPAGAKPNAFGGLDVVVAYHSDDQFGPRWHGRAGARIPDHKVIPYVTAYAADPDQHPSTLNHTVLER